MQTIRVNPIPRRTGWTLIELLLVSIIAAVLATIGFPMFSYMKARAKLASCVSHLRALHTCFNTYMLDHDMVWPQPPEGVLESSGDEQEEWEWWHKTLLPYGGTKAFWLCPADAESQDQMRNEKDDFAASYIPTQFDEVPNTAFKWSSQPWLIERGEMHGKGRGPNILMPDGTIRQGISFFQK